MISFSSKLKGFNLENSSQFQTWLKNVIKLEGKKTGDINYLFMSDDDLLVINRQYLQHDFFTDIVTFPLSESNEIISGEIYVSVDRIKDNAEQNGVKFENELKRVIVHGVLHLLGYDDHTDDEKTMMRQKEDYYINLF